MKIIDVEQHSLMWLQARAGVVTASEMDAILTPEFKARKGEGVTSYLAQKVAERWLGGSLPGFQSIDMEIGKILEDDAIPAYELEFGETITRVGLLTTDCGRIGCSPDGLIGEDGGIEIKCPRSDTHARNLIVGKIPKDYLVQVHSALYVTGRKWWKFMSYDRRFPPLVLTVQRDEGIQTLIHEAVMPFIEQIDEAMARITELNGGPPRRRAPEPMHHPDCDVNDQNADGIAKPCNCQERGASCAAPAGSVTTCKCVRGIGLNGAELGIVKDCPVHGESSGYRHVEPTECYDGEAD